MWLIFLGSEGLKSLIEKVILSWSMKGKWEIVKYTSCTLERILHPTDAWRSHKQGRFQDFQRDRAARAGAIKGSRRIGSHLSAWWSLHATERRLDFYPKQNGSHWTAISKCHILESTLWENREWKGREREYYNNWCIRWWGSEFREEEGEGGEL